MSILKASRKAKVPPQILELYSFSNEKGIKTFLFKQHDLTLLVDFTRLVFQLYVIAVVCQALFTQMREKGLLLLWLHLLIFLGAVAVIWGIFYRCRDQSRVFPGEALWGQPSYTTFSCLFTATLQFMALSTHTVKFNLMLTLNYIFPSINSSFPSPNQHSLSLYLYIWLTAPKGITMAFALFQHHSSDLPLLLSTFSRPLCLPQN